MRKVKYNYVYKFGKLIGYSCKLGFIEKHYSNPVNLAAPQNIDYRIPAFEAAGKPHIFRTATEAKDALERSE